jgi:hypothetical protein
MGGRPEGPDASDGPDGFAGLRWEPAQRPGGPGSPGDWRDWLTCSSAARRLAGILAAADAAGIAATIALIAASLIRGRAASAGVLLVPGILLLTAGQVWAILVAAARQPPGADRRFLAGAGRGRSASQDLRSLFGPVDRRVTRTVTALCVTGFLSFITAIFFTWDGGPAGPGGGCAYRLMSHGVYTCVSKTAYYLAGAAEQRIAAGSFLFFYAVHLYAALASSQAGQQAA